MKEVIKKQKEAIARFERRLDAQMMLISKLLATQRDNHRHNNAANEEVITTALLNNTDTIGKSSTC